MFYPLMIDLEQMDVLIVGGGKIAFRKFSNIKEYSKRIRVIAPEFYEEFVDIINENKDNENIDFIRRKVCLSDFENSSLVFLATDNRELNRVLSDYCKSKNILVNSVDNHNNSSFVSMGTMRADFCMDGVEEAIIGVSLFGKNPKMLKKLKKRLKEIIDDKII